MHVLVSERALNIIAKFINEYTGYSIYNFNDICVVYDVNDFDYDAIDYSNCDDSSGNPLFEFVNTFGNVYVQLCSDYIESVSDIEAQIIYMMVCMDNELLLDIDGISLSNDIDASFIELDTVYEFLSKLYNSGLVIFQ